MAPQFPALGIFVIALSSAVALAALRELWEGRWTGPRVGVRLARGGLVTPDNVAGVTVLNRTSIALRLIGPVMLGVGLLPHVSAWVTFLALVITMLLRAKHNTLYMAVAMGVIASAPDIPRVGSTSAYDTPVWTAGALSVLVLGLYLNGGLCKIQSKQFRSGATIYLICSSRFSRVLPGVEVVPRAVWRVAAHLVIAAEVMIPVLLAVPGAGHIALMLGALLHSAFAIIQPGRLVPFQIAVLGTYPVALEFLATGPWS